MSSISVVSEQSILLAICILHYFGGKGCVHWYAQLMTTPLAVPTKGSETITHKIIVCAKFHILNHEHYLKLSFDSTKPDQDISQTRIFYTQFYCSWLQ